MNSVLVQQIIEGALLAAGQPLNIDRMLQLFDGDAVDRKVIKAALGEISESCAERGFELANVASGYRFQVKKDLGPWVIKLWNEKAPRYSRALLETLSLIAYRQPITRAEIEEVRGVSVSSNIVKTLLEREWVRVVGHRDVPGRPALFATTKGFLDYFELRRLDDLPTLAEIRDLDKINKELDLAEKKPEDVANDDETGENAPTDENASAADLESGESTNQVSERESAEQSLEGLAIDFSDVDDVLNQFESNLKQAQAIGEGSAEESAGASSEETPVQGGMPDAVELDNGSEQSSAAS